MQAKYYLKRKTEQKTKDTPVGKRTISVLVPMEVTHTVIELMGDKKVIEEIVAILSEKFEVS